MSEPFIGEIRMVGFNFAPRGWAPCDGRLLPISTNTALFSLLGTTYGGDGRTTFALPDLRGRVPMAPGAGPGLSPHTLGESAGAEQVTLNASQIPAHTHPLRASAQGPSTGSPAGTALAAQDPATYSATAPAVAMHAQSVGPTGGSQPHENMQPYLCVNFVIALQGIFPTRD